MATFIETAQQLGICLEYSEAFFRNDPPEKLRRLMEIIKTSASQVIVTFLSPLDLQVLLPELARHNLTGYQWVGTEGWISDPFIARVEGYQVLYGAIGLSVPKAQVAGMREFILDVKPLKSSGSALFTKFWEALFQCRFRTAGGHDGAQRKCTGNEDLSGLQNTFTDLSFMAIFNNVYKGVHAVAYAVHKVLSCGKTCGNNPLPEPRMVS